jgi:hypothetical protein
LPAGYRFTERRSTDFDSAGLGGVLDVEDQLEHAVVHRRLDAFAVDGVVDDEALAVLAAPPYPG